MERDVVIAEVAAGLPVSLPLSPRNLLTCSPLTEVTGGLDPKRVATYLDRVTRTYEVMQRWLPEKIGTILDIGCGMGGIGLAVCGGAPGSRLLLLDGQPADSVRGSKGRHKGYRPYGEDCRPWNDAEHPAATFRRHGIDATAVLADPAATYPADVIVSTRSWGHHYPVWVYLPLVLRSLNPGGVVFLDIRAGTDGVERMQEHFQLRGAASTSKTDKCSFCVFSR